MYFDHTIIKRRSRCKAGVLFFLTILCLSIAVYSAEISYDFDLSFDHDSPGIIHQPTIFIDNTRFRIIHIKFVDKQIVLPAANGKHFLNRAPPA